MTLVSVINNAQSKVYISDAYFASDAQMLGALEAAARRGVDVRQLVPGRTNEPLIGPASLCSIVQTCKHLQINPFIYLRNGIEQVSAHPARRVFALTPHHWQRLRRNFRAQAAARVILSRRKVSGRPSFKPLTPLSSLDAVPAGSRSRSDIAPADCRYLGVDVSPTMVALARARLSTYAGRAEVRLSDGAVTIGESDGSFDRYVSNYVLDPLSRESIRQLVSEAHRLLIAGGFLCLVSLTHGGLAFQKLVSRKWSGIHSFRPALVGGCQPIELLDFVSSPERRVESREVESSLGLSS